jgi:hypothetical protein
VTTQSISISFTVREHYFCQSDAAECALSPATYRGAFILLGTKTTPCVKSSRLAIAADDLDARGRSPMCRQRTGPSLGGEAGGRSPGFICLQSITTPVQPKPKSISCTTSPPPKKSSKNSERFCAAHSQASSGSHRIWWPARPDHIKAAAELHRSRIGCDNFLNVLMGNY